MTAANDVLLCELGMGRIFRSTKVLIGRWVLFFRDVINEFLTDNCPQLAAAISYYVLLSLFPLSLALVSLLGFVAASPEMQAKVVEGIGNFLAVSPDSGESIQGILTTSMQNVVKYRGLTGAIGVVGLIIGGNAVFTTVRKSLNAAWGIRTPRPFFTERLVEFGMLSGAALFLLLSLAASSALGILRNMEITHATLLWNVTSILTSTLIVFIVFLFLYKFVPNTTVRWRDIWLGALMAAIGVEVTKGVFVWYASNYGHYNLLYGSIGSIIGLMIWVYVSAVIFLFCAKVSAVHSRTPAPTAVLVDRLWATMVELRQRLTTEPHEIASNAVDELDEHLTPVVNVLQQHFTTARKEQERRFRALLKRLLFKKTSKESKSSSGATSSPQEQSPQ